jgi:cytochrome b
MQIYVGDNVARTRSYSTGLFWVGLLPIIALVAMALFWGGATKEPAKREAAA